jgi:hypothetical protein
MAFFGYTSTTLHKRTGHALRRRRCVNNSSLRFHGGRGIVWALIATDLVMTRFDLGGLQLHTVFGFRCNGIWSQAASTQLHLATFHYNATQILKQQDAHWEMEASSKSVASV